MQVLLALNRAEDGQAERFQCGADHSVVAQGADFVQDEACDFDARVKSCKPVGDGCGGLGLVADIKDKHNRQAQYASEVCRGPFARRRCAIKEAHGAFYQQGCIARRKVAEGVFVHGPSVKVQAFGP